MSYLFVTKDGKEFINPTMPIRYGEEWYCYDLNVAGWAEDFSIELPKGSIRKLIGKELTWNDEPYKLE